MAKHAKVTSIDFSRWTAEEGEYISFTMSVEAENVDMVYVGDLVLEVDGKTVFVDEDYGVGEELQTVEVPVQFNEVGTHNVCATLMDPQPIDIM